MRIKKFIRGNKKRGEEVLKALESLGGWRPSSITGQFEDSVYYIDSEGAIAWESLNLESGKIIEDCFEEMFLPKVNKPKFDPNTLKPFDKVLVRDTDGHRWHCDFLEQYDPDFEYPYICHTAFYLQCIPYNDETKHLVRTSERPPKFYDIFD